ncbi:hypothetical protein Tco_1185462 [Tanacetum coccineum]
MPTKVELTLEQSQQGVSDDVLNIRVILFSIRNDDGNPSSVNIKQNCEDLRFRARNLVKEVLQIEPLHQQGINVGVAASFQLRQIHYHMLILKLQKSYVQLQCNKDVISQKAQVHVKFSNSDNHELPYHQRFSKSNQESSSKEIVNLRNI